VILALVKEGWLVPVEGERPVYVLARDPASIELAKLPQAVVGEGIPANVHPQVCKILTEIGPQERAAWHGRTLADLLAESDEPAPLGVGASESVADAAK
jgi:DNA-binding IscR family transcriptional regulator